MGSKIIEVEKVSKTFSIGAEQAGSQQLFSEMISSFFKQGRKLKKTEVFALKDVSFDLNHGDRLGIIGRNGAGKSTLLKVLSRITPPTSGKITLRGKVASLLEVGTGFHPELTGRENIYLNGTILGMKRADIATRFDEIVAFSEVDQYLDTPVKRYSSGMYVRLAFAVAAHLEPEILVVDEVLAVGDAQFQKKCIGKMNDVSRNSGRTVLFVSHQIGMIQSLCNKGILLSKGEIVANGNIDNVINDYVNTYEKVNDQLKNNITIERTNDLDSQIVSIKLVNDHYKLQNEFDVFENKHLLIELDVRSDNQIFSVFYYLKRKGEIILVSHENDKHENIFEPRARGRYTYKISLPPVLKAGTYSFAGVGLGQPNKGAIQFIEDILEFEICELSFDPSFSGFSRSRPGYIIADSNYKIEKFIPAL